MKIWVAQPGRAEDGSACLPLQLLLGVNTNENNFGTGVLRFFVFILSVGGRCSEK